MQPAVPAFPRKLMGVAVPRARRQQGIALVLVLWLTVLLMLIAAEFADSMRHEALAARNAASYATAKAIADGAISRAVWEVTRSLGSNAGYDRAHGVAQYIAEAGEWLPDGRPHAWEEGGVRIRVVVLDEAARINLNTASDAVLGNLLRTTGGLSADEASRLVDAIGDWKDADDLRRPNGAEAPEYRLAGRHYRPANAPFETVEELGRVLGMTPALYERIADSITVYSKQNGINSAYAPRSVLMAMPGATAEIVDKYITQREAARAAKLQVPGFPQASSFDEGVSWVWRIRAEATLADSVGFVREAVVKPNENEGLPTMYLWRAGDHF